MFFILKKNIDLLFVLIILLYGKKSFFFFVKNYGIFITYLKLLVLIKNSHFVIEFKKKCKI